MNIKLSRKYDISPEKIEKNAFNSERFRTLFNMHRIERTDKTNVRLDRFDRKKYLRKRKKLRENLDIGKKVYVLAERIKKKSAPGKFYKQSVQNISYFNKEQIYTIRKKRLIDGIKYYWVKSSLVDLPKRFQRSELFALRANFQ